MEAVAEKKEISIHEGKYLTFILGSEEYGIEIIKVREIIGIMDITTVPQTPDYMKGVINLRGKVIPVIDLRLKFSMTEEKYTQETCVIVVEVNNTHVGIIVDNVSEVQDINGSEIEDSPELGQGIDTDFIIGMGKVEEKIIILLDIEKVLSSGDLDMAKQISESE
jgi:purine-binding chemotaxis protein CheW